MSNETNESVFHVETLKNGSIKVEVIGSAVNIMASLCHLFDDQPNVKQLLSTAIQAHDMSIAEKNINKTNGFKNITPSLN